MTNSPYSSFVGVKNKFTVATNAGYHLACILEVPEKPRKAASIPNTQPVVGVLCHGLFTTKDSTTIIEASVGLLLIPAVVDAIVRFDFHGEGGSEGLEHWSLGNYDLLH